MDSRTLAAYDAAAAAFADTWHAQPPPADMHTLLRRHFRPGPTADIGCGSGRDTAWLAANGFAATGYDASAGLLAEARRRYPEIAFHPAVLPDLAGIAGGRFVNILCETVLMHLPGAATTPAVTRLMTLLAPGGTLYLSWRMTDGADRRDAQGRLYAAVDPALVFAGLGDAAILHDEQGDNVSSGRTVRRLVVRKQGDTG